MELNRNESPRSSAEQLTGRKEANPLDLELAAAYVANSATSLEIPEEFEAVDQEGF